LVVEAMLGVGVLLVVILVVEGTGMSGVAAGVRMSGGELRIRAGSEVEDLSSAELSDIVSSK